MPSYLCLSCDGRGFHWHKQIKQAQTLYGQDIAATTYSQGERCETCGGAGEVYTRYTLTKFGIQLIIVALFAVVVLGQFWPEL